MDIVIIGAGQAGLAAARACLDFGLNPILLEASPTPTGSWPHYYDSLTLFSPARHSSLPGMRFPGDPERYPHRDEVIAYLSRYAAHLDTDIHTGTRVTTVTSAGDGFAVHTEGGATFTAAGLIAATGSFTNPHLPTLPGQVGFTGQILHSSAYTNPEPYAGTRAVVVGAGNSAVQIAYELGKVAQVTLATRTPIRFADQRPLGHDVHFWFAITGFDRLPARLVRTPPAQPVLDDGIYRQGLRDGIIGRRPMFTAFDGDHIIWNDGTPEPVDLVVFATGYRPDLDYLRPLGALDDSGQPRHVNGVSTTHPRMGYLGLEWQRTPSSNSLRGVGRDARYLVRKLAARRPRPKLRG